MTPSFIQIGETYYATIKTGRDENVIKENGRNKPFDSATRAMNAAIKAIEAKSRIELPSHEPKPPKEPDLVLSWRQERLRQRQADREMATLLGIEVVTVKRKKVIHK